MISEEFINHMITGFFVYYFVLLPIAVIFICVSAALLIHVTYRIARYTINITKEETWLNEKTITTKLEQSKLREASIEKSTLPAVVTWSPGEEDLERSPLTARSNRRREPAAVSGSKE